jgi:dienelactone hydrolase
VRLLVLASGSLAVLLAGCATIAPTPPGRARTSEDTPTFSVAEPTAGLAADGGPRGVMLVLHGGGWQSRGERSLADPRNVAEVERWRARGWRTVAVAYRSSSVGPADLWPFFVIGQVLPTSAGSARRSIDDTISVYDHVRAQLAGDLPVCATGWSAGGHLALLLAAARPELACVVGLAAPTDLPALVEAWTEGGRAAAFAFGLEAAGTRGNGLSPVDVAGSMRARILLATAANDRWVPPAQMDALRAALERSGSAAPLTTMELEPGRLLFWHGHVSVRSLDAFHAAEESLGAVVAGRPEPAG